jgi:hypothetical protein
MKGASPEGAASLWTLALGHHGGPYANAQLRADARGRDGGVRQELAAGADVMTNNDDMHFPALVWAVIFTILLVAAVAIFTLVLTR